MSPIDIRKTAPLAPLRALPDRAAISHPGGAGAAAPEPGVRVDLTEANEWQTAPVDHDRVTQIRDALRDGTYPIVPARIADALIAAKLALGGPA